MNAVPDGTNAWAVRRVRSVMLETLPNTPRALCHTEGHDPDLWHPERPTKAQEEQAKEICNRCFDRVECLAYALRVHRVPGIWGGLTEGDRVVLVESLTMRLSTAVQT